MLMVIIIIIIPCTIQLLTWFVVEEFTIEQLVNWFVRETKSKWMSKMKGIVFESENIL